MFVLLRIFLGGVFLLSGGAKILAPYQNFLYVIQGYQVFPSAIEQVIAIVFPWVEFLAGLFLVLGLMTLAALRFSLVLYAGFITLLGQALMRKIPLGDCGCFGEAMHFPPSTTIVFDSICFLLLIWMIRHGAKVQCFSLDQKFKQ